MTLSLIIAGGIFLTSPKAATTTEILYDHTLRGEPIPASDVVTWNRFGTPMLPDGKGGYSLIAPINQEYINLSLKQPPRPSDPSFRPYRPAATVFANPVSATLPVATESTEVYADAAPAAPLTSAVSAPTEATGDIEATPDQEAAPVATEEAPAADAEEAATSAEEEAAPATETSTSTEATEE